MDRKHVNAVPDLYRPAQRWDLSQHAEPFEHNIVHEKGRTP